MLTKQIVNDDVSKDSPIGLSEGHLILYPQHVSSRSLRALVLIFIVI